MNNNKLKLLLQNFLNEDIGDGDITSETIFTSNDNVEGQFIMKEDGIIAGLQIIEAAYSILDSSINVKTYVRDGDNIKAGNIIASVSGPIIPLLSGERVILNLLQRMSAISSTTKKAIDLLADSHIKICDTRKTTPGIRMLEKYAVRCGGGYNHRFGLYDGVLIKDNHIAFTGSISNAINKVKEQLGHMIKIEVETETREDVIEAIQAGADVILLDNFTPEQVKEYCSLIPNNIVTEASGGINLSNIEKYRHTGVDYISLGMLTHSVQAIDISFNIYGGRKYEDISFRC